jgi:hypothetical protein
MKLFKMKISLSIMVLFFAACNSPYYTTVNDMKGQPASITLANGTQLNGKINVKIVSSYYTAHRISFAEGAEKEYKKYSLADIKSLYINGATYYVKTIVSTSNNKDVQRFLKEISLPGGRMALYENEVVFKNNENNTNETKLQYFVQLPNTSNNDVYNISSNKFTPNFDDKMSSYVQDCAALADKIKSKDKAYFYPFLVNDNSPRRKAVLLQIINDYNNCK